MYLLCQAPNFENSFMLHGNEKILCQSNYMLGVFCFVFCLPQPEEDSRSVDSYWEVSSTQQKKLDTSDSWFEDEQADREDRDIDQPLLPTNLLSKVEEIMKRSPSLTVNKLRLFAALG